MGFCTSTSRDAGHSWATPVATRFPRDGTLEPCHPILELQDGTWLSPTATCSSWNGDMPNGHQAVAFVSRDKGASWTETIGQY